MPTNTSKTDLTPEQKAEKELVAMANQAAKKKAKNRKPDEAPKKPGPSTGMKIAIGVFSLFIAVSMMYFL